eukprot:scaffold4627_cov157-Isochrysis_galbana.AAC.1
MYNMYEYEQFMRVACVGRARTPAAGWRALARRHVAARAQWRRGGLKLKQWCDASTYTTYTLFAARTNAGGATGRDTTLHHVFS